MSMTAHAVGVECWEEYSGEYFSFREPVSKMRDVIDEDIPIVRIKTEIEMLARVATACYDTHYSYCYFKFDPIRVALNQPISGSNSSYYYSPYFSEYNSYGASLNVSEKWISLASNMPVAKGLAKNATLDTGFTGSYLTNSYLHDNDVPVRNLHYVHTFCIANTDSGGGGGGGGAAGAAVNYIIKAN